MEHRAPNRKPGFSSPLVAWTFEALAIYCILFTTFYKTESFNQYNVTSLLSLILQRAEVKHSLIQRQSEQHNMITSQKEIYQQIGRER